MSRRKKYIQSTVSLFLPRSLKRFSAVLSVNRWSNMGWSLRAERKNRWSFSISVRINGLILLWQSNGTSVVAVTPILRRIPTLLKKTVLSPNKYIIKYWRNWLKNKQWRRFLNIAAFLGQPFREHSLLCSPWQTWKGIGCLAVHWWMNFVHWKIKSVPILFLVWLAILGNYWIFFLHVRRKISFQTVDKVHFMDDVYSLHLYLLFFLFVFVMLS